MGSSIADMFNTVRRKVVMGDRVYMVPILRVRDLADLAAFVEDERGDPLAVLDRRADFPTPESWRDAARDEFNRASRRACVGDAESASALATPRGLLAFLGVAFARAIPSVGMDGLPDLAIALLNRPESLLAVRRVTWADDPGVAFRRAIFPKKDDRDEPSAEKFVEAVGSVAVRCNLPVEAIGDLTLPAFTLMCRGGKPETDAGFAIPAGADAARFARQIKARFDAYFGVYEDAAP